MKYKRVLTIAGSDSGGGAGVQADIKAISACGAYAASAITAVTVQNTVGVKGVHPIPPEIIEGQIEAVMEDIGADAIKIGMLHSAEVVEVVCRAIDRYKPKWVVLDPVMVSTSGHRLIEQEAITLLIDELIPRASIITPNIPEAEMILGEMIENLEMMSEAVVALARKHRVNTLLKGGHMEGASLLTDLYCDAHDLSITKFSAPYINTVNTHGTGCTLSSALAAHLALGLDLIDAVGAAKSYLMEALAAGAQYSIGSGHGPVNHFYNH